MNKSAIYGLAIVLVGTSAEASIQKTFRLNQDSNTYSVQLKNGDWSAPKPVDGVIALRGFKFDPLKANFSDAVSIPAAFRAKKESNLFLVQFQTQVLEGYRSDLEARGVKLLSFIPGQSFVVKMSPEKFKEVKGLSYVRWVGPFHPAYKIAPSQDAITGGRYTIVVSDMAAKDALIKDVENAGGTIAAKGEGNLLIEALLTAEQFQKVAQSDNAQWIEKSTGAGVDMWDARIQGGADYLEPMVPGYTGHGINGHIMEGVDATHPDFSNKSTRKAPMAISDATSDSHGTCTFGQVFGDGTGNKKARGLLPDGQGFYTNYNFVYENDPTKTGVGSRYELVQRLMKDNEVMFQTASWGYDRTTEYTARSAEMDKLIFDLDLPITQSQSNSGDQDSRPQAWAKNIISIGGVQRDDHEVDPTKQYWRGGGSIGPASDGRIKPDLSAHWNNILTTEEGGGYTESFGGTSGATPIVAGYMGLSIQMWTNGIFGNYLIPGASRFQNRPHAMTTKALLINTARQWAFQGRDHDLTRTHVGWGFPSVQDMYDRRNKMIIVNETDALKNLATNKYEFDVAENETELKVTISYRDPAATLNAAVHRINNIDLKVTAPDGTIYWGNNGLLDGNYSVAGGQHDVLNTVENVILAMPAPGHWKVEVIGDDINTDTNLATSEVDATYALVINGAKK